MVPSSMGLRHNFKASAWLPLDEIKASETPEGRKKAAAAAARDKRKQRRGERRSRGRG